MAQMRAQISWAKRGWQIPSIAVAVLMSCGIATAATGSSADTTFGESGTVVTDMSTSRFSGPAYALAQDRAGRLIAAGGSNRSFALARYLPDGSADTAFDADGIVISRFPGVADEFTALDLALDQRRRLVAVGFSRGVAGGQLNGALARFLPDGRLDPSFGQKGWWFEHPPEFAFAVAIQADGKLITGGLADEFDDRGRWAREVGIVTRQKPNGRLDPSFGGPKGPVFPRGGLIRIAPRLHERAGISDIAVLPSGKILLAGYTGQAFLIARLNRNGTFDKSFGGGDGRTITDVDRDPNCLCSIGSGLAITPRHKIVVAGYVEYPNPTDYVALVRYRQDGTLDRGFGAHGVVRTHVGRNSRGYNVAVQHDGRIVVAGDSGTLAESRFAVLRYKPDGTLDRGFFGDGILVRNIGSRSTARAVIVQRDGKVVVAGGATIGGDTRFVLLRLFPDP